MYHCKPVVVVARARTHATHTQHALDVVLAPRVAAVHFAAHVAAGGVALAEHLRRALVAAGAVAAVVVLRGAVARGAEPEEEEEEG